MLLAALLMSFAVGKDAPEISTSRGNKATTVVLFPRVVSKGPSSIDLIELATAVQTKVANSVSGSVDLRPSPQRVCKRVGCKGPSLSVVLAHSGGGCAAMLAQIGPGESEQTLFVLAGEVEIKHNIIAFRQPPEAEMVIREFVPCGELLEKITLP